MLNPTNNGNLASTNAAAAGGLSLLVIWVVTFFAPEFWAAAPLGAESLLTGLWMWLITKITPSIKKSG